MIAPDFQGLKLYQRISGMEDLVNNRAVNNQVEGYLLYNVEKHGFCTAMSEAESRCKKEALSCANTEVDLLRDIIFNCS